jgi:hypothetical protein
MVSHPIAGLHMMLHVILSCEYCNNLFPWAHLAPAEMDVMEMSPLDVVHVAVQCSGFEPLPMS